MPRTCCVPGCSSNYRSTKTATITTFKFPKECNLRKKWVKAIHRKNFTPNDNSVVCVRHFRDNLVIRTDVVTRDDGSVLSVPRTVPKLVPHAVPHIFPNQPSYFTTKPVPKRKSPRDRQEEQVARDKASFVQQIENDLITDFSFFKTSVETKNNNNFGFHYFIQEDCVVFCKFDFAACPRITVSLKVLPDLSVKIWHRNVQVPTMQFQSVLGKDLKLDTWSEFDSLISRLSTFSVDKCSMDDKLKICFDLICQGAEELPENEKSSALKCLAEQLLLGKLQTDKLEGQFAQYRQMNGENYVSVTQVLETGKKLKLRSLLKFYSSECGEFELKSLSMECAENTEEMDFEYKEQVLNSYSLVSATDENIAVLVFISGYVANSVNNLVNCENCMCYLMHDKEMEVDCTTEFSYLAEINRGGLKWPTDFLINIGIIVFKIFQTLISETFEEKFMKAPNKGILSSLALEKLCEQCRNLQDRCCCGLSLSELSLQCINAFSSSFINNYCKVRNDYVAAKNAFKKCKMRKIARKNKS